MHVSSYLDPSGYAGGKFGIEVYMPTSDWKRSAPASRFSFIVSSRKVRALELRFLYAQYTYSLLRLIRSLTETIMVGMRLLSFSVVLLSSLFSVSSAVPARLELEEASLNVTSDTLLSRSLEKREVFNHCSNAGFSNTLSQALKDATDIVSPLLFRPPNNTFSLSALTCICSCPTW